MTTTQPSRRTTEQDESGTAIGVTVAAAIFMIMIGVFHAIQGVVALVNDKFYVVGAKYVFEFDVTAWGWVHIVLGVIVAFAGFALFQGATWARAVAIVAAAVSMIANFMWIPYYPLWSMTIIAFDAFVIWAVTAHPRALADAPR